MKKRRISDKIFLALNTILYRVDALLENYCDSFLLIMYTIIVYTLLGFTITFDKVIFSLLCLPLILHLSYVITYVINDIIDSNRKEKSVDYSFYKLRPVYYFKRSRYFIAYYFLLYTLFFAIMITLKSNLILYLGTFVAFIIPATIVHSLFKNMIRPITLGLMRLAKYVYLLIFFEIFVFNAVQFYPMSWVIVSLVIPYTVYAIRSYFKIKNPKKLKERKIDFTLILTILIPLLAFITILINSGYQFENIVKVTVSGYILSVLPAFLIRELLRKKFGAISSSFYDNIARLIIGDLLLLIFAIIVIYFIL